MVFNLTSQVWHRFAEPTELLPPPSCQRCRRDYNGKDVEKLLSLRGIRLSFDAEHLHRSRKELSPSCLCGELFLALCWCYIFKDTDIWRGKILVEKWQVLDHIQNLMSMMRPLSRTRRNHRRAQDHPSLLPSWQTWPLPISGALPAFRSTASHSPLQNGKCLTETNFASRGSHRWSYSTNFLMCVHGIVPGDIVHTVRRGSPLLYLSCII